MKQTCKGICMQSSERHILISGSQILQQGDRTLIRLIYYAGGKKTEVFQVGGKCMFEIDIYKIQKTE